MERYYVSGCKGQDDELVTCDDSEAEFWTLYHSMADGTSQGIIDLRFREDADAAMKVYSERDALQNKLDEKERLLNGVSQGAIDGGWTAKGLSDYAKSLEQKLGAVMAENAALKGFFETGINASFEGCDFFGDHMQSRALELGLVREEVYCKDQHENLVVDPGNFEEGDTVYFINETPSTEAILNAVRAEGACMVADYHFIRIEALKGVSRQGHLFHKAAYSDAVNVANLLRADATKGGSNDK